MVQRGADDLSAGVVSQANNPSSRYLSTTVQLDAARVADGAVPPDGAAPLPSSSSSTAALGDSSGDEIDEMGLSNVTAASLGLNSMMVGPRGLPHLGLNPGLTLLHGQLSYQQPCSLSQLK